MSRKNRQRDDIPGDGGGENEGGENEGGEEASKSAAPEFFVFPAFDRRWKSLKLTDVDWGALIEELTKQPAKGVVVRGAAGLRKLRFAPRSWDKGKSGACRVLYVYVQAFRVIALIVIYSKSEKSDLTAAEKKSAARLIEELEAELRRRAQQEASE